ncbi:hypothetical protein BCR39DRAFT_540469 [Naematelia encephala]|uniref:Uncharacterized protein n=1 Tax=Naematelia encephala TaxID=71784 RepID=A0A1Y2AW35_9TREE|nr:hypothetical protein BCR39DRAFT_540469 [Naematelia encephala]
MTTNDDKVPSNPTHSSMRQSISISTTSQAGLPRGRNASLSIARSPSILASSSISDPLSLPHTTSSGGYHNPLTRIRSRSKSRLDDTPFEENGDDEDELDHDHDQIHHHLEETDDNGEGRGDEGLRLVGGPFQKPDMREIMGIVLAVGGVIALSTAAGLTTIYDWVF